MLTTVAWMQSVDPAGAFVQLNAVPDQHVTVVGSFIRVPALNQLVAAAAMLDNTVAPQARITAPSLRLRSLFRLEPQNGQSAAAVEPDSPQKVTDLSLAPLVLVPGEDLRAEILSDPAAAQIQSVVAWLADGPLAPVRGNIFTVRATSAQVLVAQTWTNGALTFVEDLPRGRYQVVGMRAKSTGLVAARLVFVGPGASGWRPGVLGTDSEQDLEWPGFRYGDWGVFGEFEDTDPPTVDFLSVSADAAETVTLDLIQIRSP